MILSSPQQIREYTEKGSWGTATIFDFFLESRKATPDAIAVVDPSNRADITGGAPRRLTYAELADEVERLAGGLLSLGVGKDDVVMVQLPNVVELIAAYLAAARIGAILSPLPAQYRTHELKQVMAITEPKVFLTTKSLNNFPLAAMVQGVRASVPSLTAVLSLGEDLPEGVASLQELLRADRDPRLVEEHAARAAITANDILTICWTSGTEADPKGVPRSHNHWIWIAYGSVDGCELERGDTLLNPFPMVSMAGVGGMLVPWLLLGGTLVLHHPLALPVFLDQIQKEQVDYTVAPPAVLTMLLMKPELLQGVDLQSLKSVGSGSAPLPTWMVKDWQEKHGIQVVNIFGSNEGASFTSGPREFPDATDRAQYFPRFGVPGLAWRSRIAAQMETKLVEPVSKVEINVPGLPGEMAIRSPGIFPGYYRRPDLTAKCFDEEGFYYTGDLFEIAGNGNGRTLDRYRFVGRLKDIVIRGGMNISPEELEAMIATHPKVLDVAVVGAPDERLGEKVCAVVVPAKGQTVTLEEIIEYLKRKDIAVYKLPESLVLVDTLPRNPVGKVLKRLLRRP